MPTIETQQLKSSVNEPVGWQQGTIAGDDYYRLRLLQGAITGPGNRNTWDVTVHAEHGASVVAARSSEYRSARGETHSQNFIKFSAEYLEERAPREFFRSERLVDSWRARPWPSEYVCDDPQSIESFLLTHPALAPVLEEAIPHIRAAFGEVDELRLELTRDPETVDEESCLFILIRTPLAWRQALARLDRLDDAWWLEASRATDGRLCIDVDF